MAERQWNELLRPATTVQGTTITVYESLGPLPGVVWLVPHDISYGATTSQPLRDRKTGVSRNTIAGEPGLEVQEHTGVDLPSRARRAPGTDGLGAEDWKARQKREREEWERAQQASLKRQRYAGVRGYRASVMGPQVEGRVGGDQRTQAKFSSLYHRLVEATYAHTGSRTWLNYWSNAHGSMSKSDPLHSVGHDRFQAWLNESCVPWLVVNGTKLGLKFAVPPFDRSDLERTPSRFEESPATTLAKLVASYVRDPQNFVSVFGECSISPVREQGIRSSGYVLDLKKTEGISVNAETLYNHYRWSLKHSADKAAVHAAYHRILLHRFLRRRALVPKTGPLDAVGNAAERRARLLQAHRVLVFNSEGCPVSFNQQALEANGIKADLLGNATLVFKDRVDLDIVNDWTRWLYGDVLQLPLESCARAVSRMRAEISALAGAGHLA